MKEKAASIVLGTNLNVKTEKTIFIGAFAAVSAKYFDRTIVDKISKSVLALKSTVLTNNSVAKRVSMNVGIEPG
jgi:hypothetical protein